MEPTASSARFTSTCVTGGRCSANISHSTIDTRCTSIPRRHQLLGLDTERETAGNSGEQWGTVGNRHSSFPRARPASHGVYGFSEENSCSSVRTRDRAAVSSIAAAAAAAGFVAGFVAAGAWEAWEAWEECARGPIACGFWNWRGRNIIFLVGVNFVFQLEGYVAGRGWRGSRQGRAGGSYGELVARQVHHVSGCLSSCGEKRARLVPDWMRVEIDKLDFVWLGMVWFGFSFQGQVR